MRHATVQARERILAAAAANLGRHGFHRATAALIMRDSGLPPSSLYSQFGDTTRLLAALCERHARALLEATGAHDPASTLPPRQRLDALATRILACIDANPDAHAIAVRDRACLPESDRAPLDHADQVAAHQIDLAWLDLRPDLDTPERLARLTRPLRTLLLHWAEWRDPAPGGRAEADGPRAVAMVAATIDRADRPRVWPRAWPVAADRAGPGASGFAAPAAKVLAPAVRPMAAGAAWLQPADATRPRNQVVGAPPAAAPPAATLPLGAAAPAAAARAPPEVAASHPGPILCAALATRGLPVARAAGLLGLPRQRLHEIIAGQRALTADTALRLEALLGERAETWMARQARHEIDVCRRAAG